MLTRLHVVTGILGSGKTTVLEHLLEGPSPEGRPAVVVGEYAAEGFDAGRLRAAGADVTQISDAGVDEGARYVEAVQRLVRTGHYTRIFLETSGATRIGGVVRALAGDAQLSELATFSRAVTVLDAGAFAVHTDRFAAQLWAQVDVADVVVINKTDKVAEHSLDAMRQAVLERHPEARVLFCYMGQIRRQEVVGEVEEGFRTSVLRRAPSEDPPAEFESFVYRSDAIAYDRPAFGHKLLNLRGGAIARFKGKMRSYDGSHGVNGLPGQLDWEPPEGRGKTAIAFIGLGLAARQAEVTAELDRELAAQQHDPR